MVLGDDGPAVAQFLDLLAPGVEHGLDGERHAFLEFVPRTRAAVVQHLRLLVKLLANAVAAELAHHAQAVAFGKLLDRVPDVAQVGSGLDLQDAVPQRLVGQGAQALGGDGGLAHDVHAAGVAVPAVLDDGDIHVQDVALFQRLVVRDAVADLVVDGGADRLGVGVMT